MSLLRAKEAEAEVFKLNDGSQCDPDPQAEMRARIRAQYGETWAKHCRDSHRGCCFWRKSCVCECGKCVNVRAAVLL